MQTMRPYPRATIPSFARQTEWNVPSRLTRMISRQVSTDMDRASTERAMPALATRRSTGPRVALDGVEHRAGGIVVADVGEVDLRGGARAPDEIPGLLGRPPVGGVVDGDPRPRSPQGAGKPPGRCRASRR